MELQLYLDILKRRAFVIVIVAAMTILVVAIIGLLIPPVYVARATVRVLLDVGVADLTLREEYSTRLLNTYTYVLSSNPMLAEAISRLPPQTPELTESVLRDKVTVEVIPDTELISVAVEDSDPILARDLANILSDLLIGYTQEMYVGSTKSTLQIIEEQLSSMELQLESDRQELVVLTTRKDVEDTEIEALQSKIQFEEDTYDRLLERYELARLNESLRANSIAVVAPASLPSNPANALGLKEVGLSGIVGIMGGIGLALVLENLDTRIHSTEQLEYLTSFPVLGVVPGGLLPVSKSGTVVETTGDSSIEEAYRLVAVNLPALKGVVNAQSLLVTNITPREDKSAVVVNLAYTLADRGQTVFLIEGDLRNPTLFKKLGWEKDGQVDSGLSDLLLGEQALDSDAIDRIAMPVSVPGLFAIGNGGQEHVHKPTLLLASSIMEELLSYMITQGYTILFDAPPVLGTADVSVLAPKMDGVILVVKQAMSRREELRAALKQLQATQAHILGLVFVRKGHKEWE